MKTKIKRIKKNSQRQIKKIKKNIINVKNNIVKFFKEDGKKEKLIKLLTRIWNFLKRKDVLEIILLCLPFIIIDLSTRLFAHQIEFYPIFSISPRLFSLAYIILFVGIILNIGKKKDKIVYSLIFLICFALYLVNNIYYSATNNFFSFSMMELASEGSGYIYDVLKTCNFYVYVVAVVILITFILSLRYFPNSKTNNKKIIMMIFIFLLLHTFAKCCLGRANFELTWDTWRNPRNVYNNFNDSNKCLALAGIYEYSVRDFYITYIKPETKKSETESKFLEEVFSEEHNSFSNNKYTGIFKDKNVIFLQMEGIDNWLLTEDIMPNTYSLLNNSINFNNHYSFFNGGGSTFNSEFAVNTGYMTPYTYPINAYTLNKNDFPYSMANLMKVMDYSIKAFHMNSSEYYSRGINYSNFGFDRYFGLKDLGTYTDNSYNLDRELILNKTFYDEMFKNEGKFIDYIITYSNHLPFTTSKGVCRQLINIDYAEQLEPLSKSEREEFINNLNLTEEDCIKRQAQETDYMVGLLMQALKDNGLYDNTIIVAFTDHYLYTATNETLSSHKDTSTNLVNKTPFFIWSSNQKRVDINKVTSQLNILPTFLNLMGVEYNEKWYVFRDALGNNDTLTIFSDLSWYDGNIYVVDGQVKNNKSVDELTLEEKNSLVEYYVKKNDLVLKYNYFKEIMN